MSNSDNGGWRPIETAPRDGTWVLAIWSQSPRTIEAARVFGSGSWETGGEDGLRTPTHWMPLPSLPEPEPDDEAKAVELLRQGIIIAGGCSAAAESMRLGWRDRAIAFLAAHDADQGGGA